jgi:hypothetical protein
MKFMIILKGDQYCKPGSVTEGLFADMTRYNHALVRAGIMVAAEGLHPSARGARVERSDGKRTVVHGPFTDPGELIAGFWLWQTSSLREAIEWVKRCPLANKADAQIEIRQLYDFGDFGNGSAEDGRNVAEFNEPLVAA